MTDWNKGDIVELKTGGPPMTIDRIRPDGRVRCFWFKGTERYSGSFDSETLKSPPEATAPMVVT